MRENAWKNANLSSLIKKRETRTSGNTWVQATSTRQVFDLTNLAEKTAAVAVARLVAVVAAALESSEPTFAAGRC